MTEDSYRVIQKVTDGNLTRYTTGVKPQPTPSLYFVAKLQSF